MNGIFMWSMGVFPIACLFVLIVVGHIKIEKAAALSLMTAILISFLVAKTSWYGIAIDCMKGLWGVIPIVIVIWSALYLYEILNRTNALHVMKKYVMKKSQDELYLVLIFAWVFSSFLQGITGFGVPVAVCAPILITLGVKPKWSIIITLFGHAWANTFGTFALGWQALLMQSDISNINSLAVSSALFLWFVNLFGGLVICWLYGKRNAVLHMFPFLVLISFIQGGGGVLVAMMNPTVAAFVPTTIALFVAIILPCIGKYQRQWKLKSDIMQTNKMEEDNKGEYFNIINAVFPFVVLSVISVLILMVKPLNNQLSKVVWSIRIPAIQTGLGFSNEAIDAYAPFAIFTSAGFVIALTSLIVLIYYGRRKYIGKRDICYINKKVFPKAMQVSMGVICLVVMSQVLKGSGMLQVVALGIADVMGSMYGFVSPLIGCMGTFITSSNTSSNILFGGFQVSVAQALDIKEYIIMAGQTVGGAIGTAIGPTTILLGTTNAECAGSEGDIMKTAVPICLVQVFVIGVIVLLIV